MHLLGVLCITGCAVARNPEIERTGLPPAVPRAERDFARLEREVLDALNAARTDPRTTARTMDVLASYYEGRLFRRPGAPTPIQTNEGPAAAREAAAALRAQTPVQALTLSAALSRAARDHVNDQSRGAVGHDGTDGSSTASRVGRYGTWQVSLSENIGYSPVVHGREVIENLIIDDGVSDRGHRRNIYDPSATLVGIACGPHARYSVNCVMVQAGGFIPK